MEEGKHPEIKKKTKKIERAKKLTIKITIK